MASELNMNTTGLSDSITRTIQNPRALSTWSRYKCSVDVRLNMKFPFQCSVTVFLQFLQDLVDQGKDFSTMKVFLVSQIGFDNKTVEQHFLVCRFMKGAHHTLLVSKLVSPSWYLYLMLFQCPLFKPLVKIDCRLRCRCC